VDRLLSDSRVPPGDMFVHRNIATLVVQTDMNLLSILQYAIDVQVNYLTVCGQCGCGGVKAAMNDAHHGLIDNWLRAVKDTQQYLLDGTGRAGRARPLRPDGRDERHRASLQPGQDQYRPVRVAKPRQDVYQRLGARSAPLIHPPSDEHDQQRAGGSDRLQVPQRHGEQPALTDSTPLPLSSHALATCGERFRVDLRAKRRERGKS